MRDGVGRWLRWAWLGTVLMAVSPILLFAALIAWIAFPNIGLPFGYYGELNRALSSLRREPNVAVTRYGANYDVHLEEISFQLRVSDRWTVQVFVPDDTEFEDARCMVIQSVDGVSMGAVGPYPEWSGLAFSLVPGGDLEQILGTRPESTAGAIASIERLAAYISSSPADDLRAKHEPSEIPAGSIMLKVARVP